MDTIALAEALAIATPQDWMQDFYVEGGYVQHTCFTCLRTFRSLPKREQCFRCTGGYVDQRSTSVYPKSR